MKYLKEFKHRRIQNIKSLKIFILSSLIISFYSIGQVNKKNEIIIGLLSNEIEFETLDSNYRNDYDISAIAVHLNGMNLQFVTPTLKKNIDIINLAIHSNYCAIHLVDDSLLINKNFVLTLKENNANYEHKIYSILKDNFKTKEEYNLVVKLMSLNEVNYRLKFITLDFSDILADMFWFDKKINVDPEYLFDIYNKNAVDSAYKQLNCFDLPIVFFKFTNSLKDDEELILFFLRQSEDIAYFLNPNIKHNFLNDKKTIFKALNRNGKFLKFLKLEMRSDKQFVLTAIKQSGLALEFASSNLRKDKNIVLKAVSKDGNSLRYASDDLRNNKKVVLKAVSIDGDALHYASDELKNNKKVVLKAVSKDGNALRYASDELKYNKKVFLKARKKQ